MFRPIAVKFATAPKFSCALSRVKPITLRHTFSTQQSTQKLQPTYTHSLFQSRSQRFFAQQQIRFFSAHTGHGSQTPSSGAEHATEPKIDVEGKDVPPPVQSFDQIPNFPKELADNIKSFGWQRMIKVQQHAIPAALNNRDLLISSQTGTGKTAAFLIPMLINILNEAKTAPSLKSRVEYTVHPRGLILVPTRELAQQVAREAEKLSAGTSIKAMAIFGGVPAQQQLAQLYRLKPEIIVATPGRFIDLRARGCIATNKVNHVVLDEGDMMLDMGFMPAIQDVLGDPNFNPSRQLMMFSATFPKGIKAVAEEFLRNPVRIFVGLNKPSALVTQKVVYVSGNSQKETMLLDFVKTSQGRVLVFAETKRRTDALFHYLRFNGIRVACIHGDHVQTERDLAVEAFIKGDVSVLVATNVAARGLDIKGVSHVVNYDFPTSMEPYIHRIGRTGRAGVAGTALSFFSDADFERAEDLRKVLTESNQEVPDFLQVGRPMRSRNLAIDVDYPPQQQDYPPQQGYPPRQGYAPRQGYPQQQQGYPPQQQQGYPPQQGYRRPQQDYPQRGYPPQQGYSQRPPRQQFGQQGYPSQQGYSSPQGQGYSAQQGSPSQRGYSSPQGYSAQQGSSPQQGYSGQPRQQNERRSYPQEGYTGRQDTTKGRRSPFQAGSTQPEFDDAPSQQNGEQLDLMSLLNDNRK